MNTPVENWDASHEHVKVFFDLLNRRLLHYGPSASWRPLTKSAMGPKATVLRGEIDFCPDQSLLQELQTKFPSLTLVPLASVSESNSLRPYREIAHPHSVKMTLMPLVPFPKLSVNMVISHDDPDHEILLLDIEKQWAMRGFVVGGIDFDFQMRNVQCTYASKLDRMETFSALKTHLSGSSWTPREALLSIMHVVSENKDRWIEPLAPDSYSSGPIDDIVEFLCQQIRSIFFTATITPITFDNGLTLETVQFVEPLSLNPSLQWNLNISRSTKVTISILPAAARNSITVSEHNIR